MVEKAAWSETPDASGFRVQDQIRAITIHHTAVALVANRDAPARFRQHEAYHRSQGWPDIAYHLLIDREGNVYEGRPLWAIGDTFTNYDPTGHFLPALEGDFDSQEPSAAQTEALASVTAWAVNHYGLELDVIAGHRDLAATSCPGSRLYSFITSREFTNAVAARTARGVELTYLTGTAAAELVESIEA
ncbi:MAG: peptidoglycan recognition protein family protein [Acidimicrobiia bacterium]|nr:peptidoglycan recognition protein family protein [Acidimicrobiia bacterium]